MDLTIKGEREVRYMGVHGIAGKAQHDSSVSLFYLKVFCRYTCICFEPTTSKYSSNDLSPRRKETSVL